MWLNRNFMKCPYRLISKHLFKCKHPCRVRLAVSSDDVWILGFHNLALNVPVIYNPLLDIHGSVHLCFCYRIYFSWLIWYIYLCILPTPHWLNTSKVFLMIRVKQPVLKRAKSKKKSKQTNKQKTASTNHRKTNQKAYTLCRIIGTHLCVCTWDYVPLVWNVNYLNAAHIWAIDT